jgi:hypothetical protein
MSLGQDLKLRSSKYEAGVLIIWSRSQNLHQSHKSTRLQNIRKGSTET